METVLVTLAALVGAAWLGFVAQRLGQAQTRLDMLRNQRRKDRQMSR